MSQMHDAIQRQVDAVNRVMDHVGGFYDRVEFRVVFEVTCSSSDYWGRGTHQSYSEAELQETLKSMAGSIAFHEAARRVGLKEDLSNWNEMYPKAIEESERILNASYLLEDAE